MEELGIADRHRLKQCMWKYKGLGEFGLLDQRGRRKDSTLMISEMWTRHKGEFKPIFKIYNQHRPQRRLNKLPPVEYRKQLIFFCYFICFFSEYQK